MYLLCDREAEIGRDVIVREWNEGASIANVPNQLRLDLALTNTQITSWV